MVRACRRVCVCVCLGELKPRLVRSARFNAFAKYGNIAARIYIRTYTTGRARLSMKRREVLQRSLASSMYHLTYIS